MAWAMYIVMAWLQIAECTPFGPDGNDGIVRHPLFFSRLGFFFGGAGGVESDSGLGEGKADDAMAAHCPDSSTRLATPLLHVYGHVCRHVYRHVFRHVYRCIDMCIDMCIDV